MSARGEEQYKSWSGSNVHSKMRVIGADRSNMKHRLMKHDLKVVENVIAKSLLVSLLICYISFLLDETLAGDCINLFNGDACCFILFDL